MDDKKITEIELLEKLQSEEILLTPLRIYSAQREPARERGRADALIEVGLSGSDERFRFIVEAKAQSTPLAVQAAIAQVRTYVQGEEYPMVLVPYLSPERIDELERVQVSGVDLCGNGVVIVPNRLYILRTGQPNLYRESRPLNNPYAGRSSLVARMLLSQPEWPSLKELVKAIQEAGAELSMPQASKAINALRDDLLLPKMGNTIKLTEPLRLLDKLAKSWRQPKVRSRQSLRLPQELNWPSALSSSSTLRWAVTGASSVSRYAAFSQAGPLRIAVSNITTALENLDGKLEPVPSFADIELWELDEAGFYFKNEVDAQGIRWASRLQAWLELQAGDARQQDAARDIRQQMLAGVAQ